jgi:hypothetical protein
LTLAPPARVRYLSRLETLLKQSDPRLLVTHQVEFKNFFGAVTGYVDGHIFVSCGKFGVALRLPPENLAELFREDDVSRLRYFPKGHVKRAYAVVPQRMMDDRGRFTRLVETSVQYALSMSR